ncbi:MAG TPA: ABC transporter permease [Gemmataceae bacterium]|jgi:putative ABC transport system permease protein|nr:ABC transporter permease [Gemmataceae bacterium]
MACHRTLSTLRLGLKSIRVHPLRSSLTVMGIVLGVASVILMLAIGEAARFQAIQQIKDLGATNIIVRSVKPAEEDKRQNTRQFILNYGLTLADMERIAVTIPTVSSVTPMREFRKDVRFLDRKLDARVVGVSPNFLQMNGLKMSLGRFVSDMDDETYANVAVLGAELAEKLFPVDDPIGQLVHIGEQHSYTVIGVTEQRAPSAGIGSSLSAQDFNRDAYIPFATDQVRFGKMLITVKTGSRQFEKLEVSQITVAVDDMTHVKKTADIIQGLLDQYHMQKDTSITIPLDLLQKAEETQRIFTLVLGAIASISLVVGGIGIMNIMLATVTERTREIGIRRALGAKRGDIGAQFLMETVVLSSTGGLLGVTLGIALSYTVTHFFAFPTIVQLWSPVLAFSVSVAVGLIFGTYPARRAAYMDPIEALRHE